MQKLNYMLHIFLLSLQVHHNNAFLTTTEINRVCQHDNKTFQECDVMFYTNWTVCDGKTCLSGQLTRDKGICCIQDNIGTKYTLKEWCIQRCNFTKEDFREIVSRNVSTGFGTEASDTNQGNCKMFMYIIKMNKYWEGENVGLQIHIRCLNVHSIVQNHISGVSIKHLFFL